MILNKYIATFLMCLLREISPVPLQVIERANLSPDDHKDLIIPIIPSQKEQHLNLDPVLTDSKFMDPLPKTEAHNNGKDKDFESFLDSLNDPADGHLDNFHKDTFHTTDVRHPGSDHNMIFHDNLHTSDMLHQDFSHNMDFHDNLHTSDMVHPDPNHNMDFHDNLHISDMLHPDPNHNMDFHDNLHTSDMLHPDPNHNMDFHDNLHTSDMLHPDSNHNMDLHDNLHISDVHYQDSDHNKFPTIDNIQPDRNILNNKNNNEKIQRDEDQYDDIDQVFGTNLNKQKPGQNGFHKILDEQDNGNHQPLGHASNNGIEHKTNRENPLGHIGTLLSNAVGSILNGIRNLAEGVGQRHEPDTDYKVNEESDTIPVSKGTGPFNGKRPIISEVGSLGSEDDSVDSDLPLQPGVGYVGRDRETMGFGMRPYGPNVQPFGPSATPFGGGATPFGPGVRPYGPGVPPFVSGGGPYGPGIGFFQPGMGRDRGIMRPDMENMGPMRRGMGSDMENMGPMRRGMGSMGEGLENLDNNGPLRRGMGSMGEGIESLDNNRPITGQFQVNNGNGIMGGRGKKTSDANYDSLLNGGTEMNRGKLNTNNGAGIRYGENFKDTKFPENVDDDIDDDEDWDDERFNVNVPTNGLFRPLGRRFLNRIL